MHAISPEDPSTTPAELIPLAPASTLEEAPKPLTRYDEMIVSIGRTVFRPAGVSFLPMFDREVLEDGNKQVAREFGSSARELIIVGPDAVKFDDQPAEVIREKRAAELLGLMIARRELVKSSLYVADGFGNGGFASRAVEQQTLWKSRTAIKQIVDQQGAPVLTEQGAKGGFMSGIPDVIVRDLRTTSEYNRERLRLSQPAFTRYIFEGGIQPDMTGDPSQVQAARRAMQLAAGNLFEDQGKAFVRQERFKLLNERTGRAIASRTDQYEAANTLVNQLGSTEVEARTAIANELEQDWQAKAACRGPQAALFFPPPQFERKDEKIDREIRAKAICDTCSVKRECLDYALSIREPSGIWGGLNEQERRRLLGVPPRRGRSY